MRTNLTAIREAIKSHGADSIVCVLSTTSCFAPRAADDVENISEICKEYGIGHVINNAYGLQLSNVATLSTKPAGGAESMPSFKVLTRI